MPQKIVTTQVVVSNLDSCCRLVGAIALSLYYILQAMSLPLPPKVRCLLTPTPLCSSLTLTLTNGTPGNIVSTVSQNLTPTAIPKQTSGSATPTVFKHVALHPCQPLVAYFCEEHQTTSNQALVSRRFLVQHTVTRQILDSISLADIAYLVYRETDSTKIPAAVQSLGQIVSLAFYDANTLFYSGMSVPEPDDEREPKRWQTLIIQTTNRLILWNIKQGPGSHSVLYPSRKMSQFKRCKYSCIALDRD